MSGGRKPLSKMLSVLYNQDAGCMSCATTSGFRVFTTEPFTESHQRDFETGGVALAAMLFRSNIFALVGGGPIPKYPPNKVMIWDDHQGRAIGELKFKTIVRAVILRKDRVAVAVEHRVFLYDLEDLRLIHQAETAPNPDGLMALSPAADAIVLASPGTKMGQLRVDLLDTRRVQLINAHHRHPLAAIALAHNGKLVATASEKGTLIRVFSTGDGTQLNEVRRGSDPARIYSIAFSRGDNPEWLAASSDKGTVHIFSLTSRNGASAAAAAASIDVQGSAEGDAAQSPQKASSGRRLNLASLSKLVPASVGGSFLTSEWSWAQYKMPDAYKCLVAFGRDKNIVLVASVTGGFHKVAFNPDKKGPADLVSFFEFMAEA